MIKACLFDLYGTLVSGAKEGGAAIPASWNDSVEYLGNLGNIDPRDKRNNLNDRSKAFFGLSGAQSPETLLPGALDFVKELHHNDIKLASISTEGHPASVLSRVGLFSMFDYIVDPANESGQPAERVLLHAAARLGVPPAECVVFGRTPQGIEAARRAGIRCVVVGDLNHLHQNAAMGIRSLSGFTLQRLKGGVEVPRYQC